MSSKSLLAKNNGLIHGLSRDLRVHLEPAMDSDVVSVSQPSEAGFKDATTVQELVESIPRLGGYIHNIRSYR